MVSMDRLLKPGTLLRIKKNPKISTLNAKHDVDGPWRWYYAQFTDVFISTGRKDTRDHLIEVIDPHGVLVWLYKGRFMEAK